ncbi:MAG: diguanylate cyclase [Acidobacteria bacterium]|nr:diguanylate cyclase [Acidobacteriota bacterium]MCI0719020.1 diguanylate cyclase [Acidobacteriota bacterium]
MIPTLRNLDNLGRILETLKPIRLRLLTSIENEASIPEFLDGVRTTLNLEDLALYFVNPEKQKLGTGSRSGIYRFRREYLASVDIKGSIPGKAVMTAQTVLEPYVAGPVASQELIQPRMELAIPIKIGQEVVGSLDSLIPDGKRLLGYHYAVLELAAVDLAIALTNLRAVKRLKDRLSTDELTGLCNQKHFLERLEIELKRSNRNGSSLGILLFSIDNMAEISELGYSVREKAVRHIAQLLSRKTRATDVLARFGDTEFTLTLGGCDLETSLFVAEKFRKLVSDQSDDDLGPVTVSVGIATYPVHTTDKDELVFLARQAACLARYGGGDQVSTIGSDAMRTMALKAFSAMLNPEHFQTGPQVASDVAARLEALAGEPIFSPVVQQIVESLASAIDAKDRYTKNHSEEATIYAEALGRACELPEKQLELVKMAAKLHDLGKIGVPEQILRKAGPLNDEEWQIMREHPTLGAKILQPIESLAELVPIVQCHHERWNGSGYPAGLKGTQIPLEARLIAVIDSFHAIISERPYKKAMPVSYALDQLRNQAGTNFDPDLIETFCSIVDADGNIRVPEQREFPTLVASSGFQLADERIHPFPEASTMTTRRKPAILLVDDDLNLLNMLEMGLRADYDVVSVFDPKRALEVLEQGNFDVVITDVIMPGLSGFEILRRVKETSELVEVILLTGELPDKVRPAVTALQDGAHDYLIKPVSLLELRATVQKALDKQRQRMENKQRLQELIQRAHTDYLTGLSNRSYFCSQLNLEFERSRRHARSLGCLVFDVDRYKKVNDEYGHGCGDLVLQRLGTLVMKNSRSTDLKCRYGGDEFVLVLPETDEAGSMIFAEKLRCLVGREVYDFADQTLKVTISLGVATFQDKNFHSPEELIHAADAALLSAKREGGNCVRSSGELPSSSLPSLLSAALNEVCLDARPG